MLTWVSDRQQGCAKGLLRGEIALDPVAESASCAAYSSFLISKARLSYGPY